MQGKEGKSPKDPHPKVEQSMGKKRSPGIPRRRIGARERDQLWAAIMGCMGFELWMTRPRFQGLNWGVLCWRKAAQHV